MTLPNKITLVRIALIPVFVTMALYYGRSVTKGEPLEWMRWTAIGIFLLAAASDGIDGYIARRYHQMSRLGAILDPIADKGLLLSGIITLSICNWHYEFPLWFPVLVLSRDIIIVSGAVVLHWLHRDFRVRPSWLGKAATVAQMVAIGCVMLLSGAQWEVKLGGFRMSVLDVPVFIAGLLTFISSFGYIRQGLRLMHAAGHGEPRSARDWQQ